jgi:hypothetical protein
MLAAGILVTLLVNPNLFAQDCVLVFLALAALWPVPRRLALAVIVTIVAMADLILLDQLLVTPHLFTLGLVGLVVLVCLRAPRRRLAAGWVIRPGPNMTCPPAERRCAPASVTAFRRRASQGESRLERASHLVPRRPVGG